MTQLRQRMIEDMQLRNYSKVTVRRYVECVAAFARFFGRCPSGLGPEEVRAFQVHLAVELKRSYTVLNQTVCALRFLYRVTLDAPFDIKMIPYARREKRLPVVLSRDEIETLIAKTRNPKHRAVIATFYSTGVRLSELRSLRTEHIDASRGTIRVHGKGSKHREVPLSPRLLTLLREYWRMAEVDSPWLFPGAKPGQPLCRETLQKIVSRAAKAAGVTKRVCPHLLRHTFATHLLESGVDLIRIQRILGHSSLTTTSIYLHIASDYLGSVVNPFDLLPAADDTKKNTPPKQDPESTEGGA